MQYVHSKSNRIRITQRGVHGRISDQYKCRMIRGGYDFRWSIQGCDQINSRPPLLSLRMPALELSGDSSRILDMGVLPRESPATRVGTAVEPEGRTVP